MNGPRYDAVIAGGGLSGLSLAARLASGGWRDRRVLIVDDDSMTPTAQCWAYWSPAVGPSGSAAVRPPGSPAVGPPGSAGVSDSVATAGYRQVRVHAGGRSEALPLRRYRYHLTRRESLRRAVLSLLDSRPNFEVRAGRVESVHSSVHCARTIVDGRAIESDWAFDSVTPPADARLVDARLAFTGWEVRGRDPVFDPDTPLLFDFRTPQRGDSRFVYVLPTGPHQALVELTSFVPRRATPPAPAVRDDALVAYLRDIVGCTEYEIRRTESAVLPLRAFPPPRRRGRVLAIGAAGGLIKASTGYAYQRIQRDSAAIADSLTRHGHPFALPPRRRWYQALDAILLDVLDHEPARLEQAFARLFAANPADRVLAFLDEDGTPADIVRIMASLPPLPYLRGIARRLIMRPLSGTEPVN